MTRLNAIAAAGATFLVVACGAPAATGTGAVPTSTAPVIRTDVVSRQQLSGTLTYAGAYTVINQAGPGVFTTLPAPGTILTRGQAVFRVDGKPIPLFYGDEPEWRPLAPGVTSGHDIYELQANLVALGLAPAALRVDDSYDWVTATAVRRWQASLGVPQTGTVRPGDAIYEPGPIRVTAVEPSAGMFAQPGQAVLQATSTQHTVIVDLNVALEPMVKVGDAVTVALPDGKTTAAATVTTIGSVAMAPSGGGQGGPSQTATVSMTITLTDPAGAGTLDLAPVSVGIVNDVHKGVLAVPVTALVAQANGVFAVEVVEGGGRRTVTVTTGLYDDRGLVEVTSTELREGMLVEVPTT
jgi:hypothetical protein